MKAPGNQLPTRAIMLPIMALGSQLLILILISLSNSLVLQAYQSWVKANGRENPLPDLSMSLDQLFFIGFATVCFNTPAFFPPSPLPVLVTKGWTMRKVKERGGGGGGKVLMCKFFWLAMCTCSFFSACFGCMHFFSHIP